jgi:hypothetical protein
VTIELEIKSADAAEVKGGGAVAVDRRPHGFDDHRLGHRDRRRGQRHHRARRLRRHAAQAHPEDHQGPRLAAAPRQDPGDRGVPARRPPAPEADRRRPALAARGGRARRQGPALRLDRGQGSRRALARVRPEQQYSIGYVVPQGKATKDPKTGVRRIKSLDLFEISDVLWGAMPLAGRCRPRSPRRCSRRPRQRRATPPTRPRRDEGIEVKDLGSTSRSFDDEVEAASSTSCSTSPARSSTTPPPSASPAAVRTGSTRRAACPPSFGPSRTP